MGAVLLQPAWRLVWPRDDPERVIAYVVGVDDRPGVVFEPPPIPEPIGDPYGAEYSDEY